MGDQSICIMTCMQMSQYISHRRIVAQAVVFHTAGGSLTSERCVEFRATLLHLMSLMHGLAIQHLRGDWDLQNLQPTHATDLPPPVDAAALQYVFGPRRRNVGTWRFHVADLLILQGTEEKRAQYNKYFLTSNETFSFPTWQQHRYSRARASAVQAMVAM